MQIVCDLYADMDRMGRAFVTRGDHANGSAAGAFRNSRNQTAFAGKRQARFGISKMNHGPRLSARSKSAPVNGHLPARNSRCGRNSLNVWNAVLFSRGTEAEFHTQPM